MSNRITILDPTVEFTKVTTVKQPHLDDLKGKVTAFVGTGLWQCESTIWGRLRQLLLARCHVEDTFQVDMPPGSGVESETIEDIVRKGHATIVGLAN